ncbi:N-carbamoyl-D-amino acid hydrolase [Leptospira ryugenii]|uniref:N-carbamoyl-D-amino acid hydrolase n=1 Tax=Leptospira ryugenii TaxID=1917863 RepID=A0A2P2E553_9LEPT|nr:carbon-nitrogen hydrolase family protein [Leptospira ryugenii]GBF51999.1 N-carbamoyl-D-amino acid hydrolase [Leptospira ryugenii]
MTNLFKAAAIQVTSTARISNNLTTCRNWIEKAVKEGAKLIGLPENFSFMGHEDEKKNMIGEIEEQTKSFLEETSKELGIFLLGGGFPTDAGNGKVFNTAILYGPNGEPLFTYHKAHLFDAEVGDGIRYGESRSTESGKQIPKIAKTELGDISSGICYDIRFPELFRELSKEGCEICFLPAAFTVPTGEAHWEVLLRARAIENLMYVIAPGQTGVHDPQGRRRTYGNSLIIGPWGDLLAKANQEPGIVLAELNLEMLREKRKQFPALHHRRF